MRREGILILGLVPAVLFAQKDTVAMRYAAGLTTADMSRNLHVLASDEYEGRETGKRGQKMAAAYIAAQFRAAGIAPYKDTSYYQEYPLNMVMPGPAEITIENKKYEGNKEYFNFPGLSEQVLDEKEIFFLGYGIDDEKYSDYKGADVRGKVVMVLQGEPFSEDSSSFLSGTKKASLWTTNYRLKQESARKAEAAALLIVVDDLEKEMKNNKKRLESPSLKPDLSKKEMPVIYISKEMANDILKKNKVSKLKDKISETGKPLSIVIKKRFLLKIENTVQKIQAENVLGYIEGSDLKEQLVVITAHYDHLGKDGDHIYNGADDDGSGTVAVIEMAQAFAKAKREGHGPRRSMLFMTVSGEEKGLLGSSYYTDNPVYPLKNTVCDLNIDMIGRVDEKHTGNPAYIYLIGSDKLSSQLHAISENANKTYTQLELDYTYNDERDKNRFYYRSDHYNFAKHGIPVIFYFNGVHADYHKETDEVEKIDFNKMEKITRLVFFTAWEVANRRERIVVDSNKR